MMFAIPESPPDIVCVLKDRQTELMKQLPLITAQNDAAFRLIIGPRDREDALAEVIARV